MLNDPVLATDIGTKSRERVKNSLLGVNAPIGAGYGSMIASVNVVDG